MEDSHIACLEVKEGVQFFGVYDGHGGKFEICLLLFLGNEVAEWVRDHLIDMLKNL